MLVLADMPHAACLPLPGRPHFTDQGPAMEDPLTQGIAGQFRETARNLLAMSEDRALQQTLAQVAEQWALSVSNEGPALPAELQEHLFDPMVSLRQGESGGVHMGLGLHIVRLIVDFHRGRVKAENLAAGDGVCVTMSFPATSPDA